MNISIIGAGLAGLLAGNMLRRFSPTIYEAQPELPKNHSALLRFRSPAVGDAVGVPFKEVLVRKGIWDGERIHSECTIPLANRYSQKVLEGGAIYDRSIWNLQPAKRYIAPYDLLSQMASGLDIRFERPFKFSDSDVGCIGKQVIISTVPMPTLMSRLCYDPDEDKYPAPQDTTVFSFRPIWVLRVLFSKPEMNVYQTVYNCSDDCWYRASLQGNELIVEAVSDFYNFHEPYLQAFLEKILWDCFGISSYEELQSVVTKQPIGKLSPVDAKTRNQFILWATDTHNIYSLGRFATWRNILMDDVLDDIKKIESLFTNSAYSRRLAITK